MSSYTGASPVSDPITVATPNVAQLPSAGLRLWLRSTAGLPAGGSGIARWADQSGHGNDAVQPEPYWQPQVVANQWNGLPVVHFTNNHQNSLSLPNLMAGAAGGEAIAVLRRSSTSTIIGLWAFGTSSGSRYPEYNGEILDDFAANTWYDTGPAPSGLTEFHVYDVGGDGAVWFQNFNGSAHFRHTGGNTVAFRENPVIADFDGDIAEVLVYDRVLTNAERDSIGAYLTAKYAPPAIPLLQKPVLTALLASGSQVDLNWSCANAGDTCPSAVIERQSGGGNFAAIAQVSDVAYFTDTGLTPNQTYTYRVTLRNYAGLSPSSDPVSVTTASANFPAAGLRLWLRSTAGLPAEGPVASWDDQSGLGNNAVQPSTFNQPNVIRDQINGLPAVHFDSHQWNALDLPNLMAGASGGEAFAIVRRSGTTDVLGLWAFGTNQYASRYPEVDGELLDDFASTSWARTGPAPQNLTNFNVYNVGGDGTVWFQNFNGGIHYRQPGNTVGFRSDPKIGDGGGCMFDGDIAEVIIYDHVLTDADRGMVSAYLSARYAISTDTVPPTSPTGLAASNITATSLTLTWNASTDNIGVAGYDVYRDGTPVGTSSSTTFNLSSLSPATAYSLVVQARDGAGNQSIPSPALVVTTLADTQAPSTPTGLAASNIGCTSFLLSWNSSTDDVAVAGYDVYRDGAFAGSSTATSFALSGLSPATTYSMTVRARDASGNLSATSPTLAVTTLADTQAPSTPTGLAAIGVGASRFTLTWIASSDNVSVVAYDIYRNGVLVGSSATNSIDVTGLIVATTYVMTVTARDASNNVSVPSAPLSVTTVLDTQAPTPPTSLAAPRVLGTSFTLTWTPSTDDVGVASYDVYRDGVLIGSPNTPSFVVTGLIPLTTYTMTVTARDGTGNQSTASSPLAVTTQDIPGALSGLRLWLKADAQVTQDGSGHVSSWADCTGNGLAAVQTYGSSQPQFIANQLNGLPTVHFDGGQTLYPTDILSGANAGEIIAVVRVGDKTVGGFADQNNKLWNFNQSGTGYWKDGSVCHEYNTFGLNDGNLGADIPASLVSDFHIFDTASSPELCAQYYNGVLHNSLTGQSVGFGSNPDLGSGVFFGDFAEILVFDRVLSDQERLAVNLSLNAKYALGISLDTTPPSPPAGLAADGVTGSSFRVSWSAAADNVGVVRYDILCDGSVVGTSTTCSFTVTGLSPNSAHSVAVSARDATGNMSASSQSIAVTTKAPMTAPSNVTVTNITAGSIAVSWMAQAEDAGVVGYNVFVNGTLKGNSSGTSITLTDLVPDAQQRVTVVAVDATGNLSASSSEVDATTPDGTSTGAKPSCAYIFLPVGYRPTTCFRTSAGYGNAISDNGVAFVYDSGWNLYRWHAGNLESLGQSFSPTALNRSGTATGYFGYQFGAMLADSRPPTILQTTAIGGQDSACISVWTNTVTGALQPTDIGGRWYSETWVPVTHTGFLLPALRSCLTDDNRVWFSDLAGVNFGGYTMQNGKQCRFADYFMNRSYSLQIPGGERVPVDSAPLTVTWPATKFRAEQAGYYSQGNDCGLAVTVVGGNGIACGYRDGGYFVGSRSVDYEPLFVNMNGTVLGRRVRAQPGTMQYNYSYVLDLPNGAQRELRNLPFPTISQSIDDWILAWVDDQDNPHGHTVPEYTPFAFCAQNSNGAIRYVYTNYTSLVPPEGWAFNSLDALVPPGSSRVQLGTALKLSTNEQMPFIAVPAAIAVDANRDGVITLSRQGNFDATSAATPFRFWINDDNDSGGTAPDCADNVVNGANDLKDLFPVYLDLRQLLNVLPPSTPGVTYTIKQQDNALNFVYTNLTRATAFSYQDGALTTGFGPNLDQPAASASVQNITATGVDLFSGSSSFLDAIQNHDGGILLIEGRASPVTPLVLVVKKDQFEIANIPLYLSPIKIQVTQTKNGPQGSAPKYKDAPKYGFAASLFSVWPNEEITIRVTALGPIKWEIPDHNVPDNTLSVDLSWPLTVADDNTKKIAVTIGAARFTLYIRVQGVGYLSQVEAAALDPYAATIIASYKTEAETFGAAFPRGPAMDAMRHSYWCSLSVSTFGVTAGDVSFITTAHENTNRYSDKQQAFNSTMDLANNAVGILVERQGDGLPDKPTISAELQLRYIAGEMIIWEIPRGAATPMESDSEGILTYSDGARIYR